MKLYFAPGGRSLAVHIVLRELSIPFVLEEIPTEADRSAHVTLKEKTGLGQVPALELADGTILNETIAILLFLAERHADRELVPVDALERARCIAWMSFLQTEVAPTIGAVIHPDRYVDSDDARRELVSRVRPRVELLFGEIDRRLSGGETVLRTYSVCDPMLAVCFLWGRHIGTSMSQWPTMKTWARAMFSRPAVRTALEAEGLVRKG